MLDQQVDLCLIRRTPHQRGCFERIAGVDIRPGIEEHPDGIGRSKRRGVHERRRASPVARVLICAMRESRAHRRQIAVANRLEDSCIRRIVLRVTFCHGKSNK